MEKISKRWYDDADQVLSRLSTGAFVTVSDGKRLNTMTIAWGSIGFLWNRPVFTLYVRPSRYTDAVLNGSDSFTISVPEAGEYREALALCGTRSGRDLDKIEASGMRAVSSDKVLAPVLEIPGRHLECRILYREEFDAEGIPGPVRERHYPEGDFHRVYYGEILCAYDLM
jgi:flavin reductase (DIM6/NTAB) family NADH-FMN oxidoreductase RutF